MAGVYVAPKLAVVLFSKQLGDLFWIMTIASIPFFVVLFVSGLIQGYAWLNPENTFVQTLMALKSSHWIRFIAGVAIYILHLFITY